MPIGAALTAIRAVLWDIDGTLLDSEPLHFESMVAVCRRHGHELTQEEKDGFLGSTMAEVFAQLTAGRTLPLTLEQWATAVTDHYILNAARATPRGAVLNLVESFARRGLRQACVSNSGRKIVEANMRTLGLDHALEFAISRDDVAQGKPFPDPYLLAARRLDVPPAACVVIEDSPVGARAAKAAGMVTVAWPQQPDLVFEEVDHLVEDLEDVDWAKLTARTPVT